MFQDMDRAASLALQARNAGLTAESDLLITPGSEMIRSTIKRDGILEKLGNVGGEILASACGPCIGSWTRGGVAKVREKAAMVSDTDEQGLTEFHYLHLQSQLRLT